MVEKIETSDAPKAIGPYSQAIAAGSLLFCSGQIGLDPKTGALVAGGVATETRRAIENLRAVLVQAGATLASVVKTTVFLADLADFNTMNEIYAEYFSAPHPARSTIQAAALPRGARVEIEAIAIKAA